MYNIKLIGPTLEKDLYDKDIYKEVSKEIENPFYNFIKKASENKKLIDKYKQINIIGTPIKWFDTIILSFLYFLENKNIKYTCIIKELSWSIDNLSNYNNKKDEIFKILKESYHYNKEQINLLDKMFIKLFDSKNINFIWNSFNDKIDLYLIAYQDSSENVYNVFQDLIKKKEKIYDIVNGKNIKVN